MKLEFTPTAIEAYRRAASAPDIHNMSGRIGQPLVTKFINENIIEAIAPQIGDTIIDIGCGDASLLAAMSDKLGAACALYGVLPTDEEVSRVRSERSAEINFSKGTAITPDLNNISADKLICNGVLIYIRRSEYKSALTGFRRLCKEGAIVYIGEILEVNEHRSDDWIVNFKNFIKRFRSRISWCPRTEFIEIAKASGFALVKDLQHMHCGPDGSPYILETRRDYILRAV